MKHNTPKIVTLQLFLVVDLQLIWVYTSRSCRLSNEEKKIIQQTLNFNPFNPNQAGGGKYAHRFSNSYSSGTECRIDLKPGCIFEFIRCLEV